jgi:hypothetical protein
MPVHCPTSGALNLAQDSVHKVRAFWPFVALTVIALVNCYSPAQQMQIEKDQLLVLNLGDPVGILEQFRGTRAYRSLIQEKPFIEVELIQPLLAQKVRRGRMIFACGEVGVYTDESTGQTWTIGKKCRLR